MNLSPSCYNGSIKYDSLLNCLRDFHVRYVSMDQTIIRWFKNRDLEYSVLSLNEARSQFKKSETVFVLGGSESINTIKDSEWDFIARHDSIGMNWWPVHPFVPTYYSTNYPRQSEHREYFKQAIYRRRKDYRNTIFMLSGNRTVRRGMHPRVDPDFFPETPKCCFYSLPDPLPIKDKSEVSDETFKVTLYYRGGLSLVLDLVNKLDYKRIVLMGVDLYDSVHFYDSYPEMQWQFEMGYSDSVQQKRTTPHGTMDTSGSKLPIDEYIYALYLMYFKKNGVELFVGSKQSILTSKIPVFEFGGSSK